MCIISRCKVFTLTIALEDNKLKNENTKEVINQIFFKLFFLFDMPCTQHTQQWKKILCSHGKNTLGSESWK